MAARTWLAAIAALIAAIAVTAEHAASQETTLKGGLAASRFQTRGVEYWDERLVATTFGIHVRFAFGPIALQPEAMVTTRGAGASTAEDLEQMRLEHIEIPVLLVVPFRVATLEPFAFGGPSLMLESRCRHVLRREGLRTTVDCDPPIGELFARTAFDYGVVAGGGASHRVGGGRLSVEARHTWGLRNIHDGPGSAEVRNRSWAVMLGYALMWGEADR
jgi:hypothetical protein